MDIAMDSQQWKHDASNNFAMDNNDYEKAFESYISDVEDDDEGKEKSLFFVNNFFSRRGGILLSNCVCNLLTDSRNVLS